MRSNLYKEIILENYRNPKNTGEPEEKSEYVVSKIENPNCGDEIKTFIKLDENVITDIKYEIDGCAISTACASLLSKDVLGSEISEIKQEYDKEYISNELLKIELTPMRIKCALLARDSIVKSELSKD